VHDIGEVWANILVNVYAALIKAHGFDQNAQTDASGSGGNTVFLHLLLDGFALQPCNPTFVSARDAIIQADANRYKAVNKCTLWKAFASRGLGQKAQDYKDDATIPADC
jgi:extracellular elastinolytic metalloproteinase